MKPELRIISPSSMYPDISGPSMRTINIAKLANSSFVKTTIFSTGNCNFKGVYKGVQLIQNLNLSKRLDKMKYHFRNALYDDFCPVISQKVFFNPNDALFQIEEPFFVNELHKNKIHQYILNESDVFWEFANYPTYGIKQKIYQKLYSKKRKKAEIKAIKCASHILVCSEKDKNTILKEIPKVEEKITIIPNCINFTEYDKYLKQNSKFVEFDKNKDKSDPNKVIFIGTFPYRPNIDALNVIIHEISPNLINDTIIQVTGRNFPNFHYPQNVKMLGYVDDVKKSILESNICIAPLRYGSGTRFKILEYMAMGKPIISSSKGVEGLDCEHDLNIIIENDFKKYPQLISELLEDPDLMKRLGKNAQKLVSTKYDWNCYSKKLNDIYSHV